MVQIITDSENILALYKLLDEKEVIVHCSQSKIPSLLRCIFHCTDFYNEDE